MKRIITILAMFSFMLWWGGFTFYAGFVIQTGQKVLGSHVLMGFITQDVAPILNIVALAACLLCGIYEWVTYKLRRRFALICLSIMLLGIIGLCGLYPLMQQWLNNQTHKVIDHDKFYFLHRIYLLTNTALWVNGIVYAILATRKTVLPNSDQH